MTDNQTGAALGAFLGNLEHGDLPDDVKLKKITKLSLTLGAFIFIFHLIAGVCELIVSTQTTAVFMSLIDFAFVIVAGIHFWRNRLLSERWKLRLVFGIAAEGFVIIRFVIVLFAFMKQEFLSQSRLIAYILVILSMKVLIYIHIYDIFTGKTKAAIKKNIEEKQRLIQD